MWFVLERPVFGLEYLGQWGFLGHMALAEVGFCGVVVWLGECILGRSGENEVVVVRGGFGWSGGGFGCSGGGFGWSGGGKSYCLGR